MFCAEISVCNSFKILSGENRWRNLTSVLKIYFFVKINIFRISMLRLILNVRIFKNNHTFPAFPEIQKWYLKKTYNEYIFSCLFQRNLETPNLFEPNKSNQRQHFKNDASYQTSKINVSILDPSTQNCLKRTLTNKIFEICCSNKLGQDILDFFTKSRKKST